MERVNISILGIIYLCMLFIPNIIWCYHQPEGYDSTWENKCLIFLERVGEVLVTVFAVIRFQIFNHTIFIVLSMICMILYECYWIRYFKGKHTLQDFYQPFLYIPVPGATLPIIAFVLLGIGQQSYLLIFSSIILGIGHIGIHLQHVKEM